MDVRTVNWTLPEIVEGLAPGEVAALLAELLPAFRTDTAGRLQLLDVAIASGDREVFRSQVHSIKGSAGQIGAQAIAAYCRAIEPTVAHVPVGQLEAYAGELQELFSEACRDMAAHSGA